MSFSKKSTDLKPEVLKESEPLFAHIEDVAEADTLKVLDAMRECRVSDAHFNTTTGYAYDDIGRGKLEELYAKIFGAERALVRTQFVSGTHALATVLFGILRPGDELVSLTGKPYDTMQTVIGYDNPSPGSLKEFGVLYNELPMVAGKVDMAHIKDVITDKTKMVEIQRSRGYSMRSPLSIASNPTASASSTTATANSSTTRSRRRPEPTSWPARSSRTPAAASRRLAATSSVATISSSSPRTA